MSAVEQGAVSGGRRRAVAWLPGVLVAGALLAFIARRLDWGEVGALLADSRPDLLVPAAVLLAVHYAVKALRWRALMGVVETEDGARRVPVGVAVRLTYIGFLMNNFFPARVGELGRPYLLSKDQRGVSFSFALATVLGSKLFDLLFTILCLLSAALMVTLPDVARTGITVLSIFGLIGFALGLAAARWREQTTALFQKLVRPLGARADALTRGADHFLAGLATLVVPARFFVATGWTVVAFSLMGVVLWLCLHAVGVGGSAADSVFVMGMLGVGFAIPSPPTHAGTYHFFAVQAVVLTGLASNEAAFSFAVVAHALQVAVVTLCGLASTVGTDWRIWRRPQPVAPA